jgi:hypothetical protein
LLAAVPDVGLSKTEINNGVLSIIFSLPPQFCRRVFQKLIEDLFV